MPHDLKLLQAILQDAASPDFALTFRPMFGGVMGYADGKPFASLSDVGLALKFAGDDHAAIVALDGAIALRYAPDQPASKSYVVVPEPMLADHAALRVWIMRSVSSLKPARPRRPKAAAR